MYKFLVIEGSCGNPPDIGSCEIQANTMATQGYELVQVCHTTTLSCLGRARSAIVMVFREKS